MFLVRMEDFCFSSRRRRRLFGFHCKSNAPETAKDSWTLQGKQAENNQKPSGPSCWEINPLKLWVFQELCAAAQSQCPALHLPLVGNQGSSCSFTEHLLPVNRVCMPLAEPPSAPAACKVKSTRNRSLSLEWGCVMSPLKFCPFQNWI